MTAAKYNPSTAFIRSKHGIAKIIPPEVVTTEIIDNVVGDTPVNNADGGGGYPLLDHAGLYFCCYYNSDRRMVAAQRDMAGQWKYAELDQTLLWDSHNYIAMGVDRKGYIHVSGNMHASTLVYYRSASPHDIRSFQAIHSMTGKDEQQVTYPKFIRDTNGDLLFSYRSGTSGSANIIINKLNASTMRWTRISSKPIIDGEGIRSSYIYGPVTGPDRMFHSCWVWRESPDAETCLRLCYARTKDLVNWEGISGKDIPIPITFHHSDVIVDDVPIRSGIINNNHVIGFDSQGRALVAYHKYDLFGNTQIYVARQASGEWTSRKTTSWDWRWNVEGRGSLVFDLKIHSVLTLSESYIAVDYQRRGYGSGTLILDSRDLQVVADVPYSISLPREILASAEDGNDLKNNMSFSDPVHSSKLSTSLLHWTSLPENRDLPAASHLSISSKLRFIKIKPGYLKYV